MTQNSYLQDRNSNFEQFQEATSRQMQRKDRLIEDLKENIKREKLRAATAEQNVNAATTNEETWRNRASQARSLADQKDHEYATLVACRNAENSKYQGSLTRLQHDFRVLTESRVCDQERYERLEVVCEQQGQTISQLQEINNKIHNNFQNYRSEIDRLLAEMRSQATSDGARVGQTVKEMDEVRGEMRWVIGLDRFRRNSSTPMPRATENTPV